MKLLEAKTEIINETLDKVSDHAMIIMKCKNKKVEVGQGGRRMVIPNSRTSLT